MLTGKCKEAFDKWYPEYLGSINKWAGCEHPEDIIQEFYKIALPSMQWGVYVDFFDSVGLNILITVECDFGYIIAEHRYEEIEEVKKWYNERQEARTAAIEKANELYNNKLNKETK